MRQELRELLAQAPPAFRDTGPAPALSAADRARLESLGYAGTQVREESDGPEIERFEPQGGNPADYAAYIELTQQARQAINRGEYQAAEEMLRAVVESLQNSTQVCELQAMALIFQRRPQEALPVLKRALALAPDDRGLRGTYASALNEAGRYQEAAEQFRIVLSDNAQDPRMLHNMAISLTRLGRFAEADQHLQLALNIESHARRCTRWVLSSHQRRLRRPSVTWCRLEIDPTSGSARRSAPPARARSRLKPWYHRGRLGRPVCPDYSAFVRQTL